MVYPFNFSRWKICDLDRWFSRNVRCKWIDVCTAGFCFRPVRILDFLMLAFTSWFTFQWWRQRKKDHAVRLNMYPVNGSVIWLYTTWIPDVCNNMQKQQHNCIGVIILDRNAINRRRSICQKVNQRVIGQSCYVALRNAVPYQIIQTDPNDYKLNTARAPRITQCDRSLCC